MSLRSPCNSPPSRKIANRNLVYPRGVSPQLTEVRGDAAAVVVELAPRDPYNSPPCGLQHPVAGAVALERGGCAVEPATVQFDDEPMGAPHAVAFHPPAPHLDPGIDLRPR